MRVTWIAAAVAVAVIATATPRRALAGAARPPGGSACAANAKAANLNFTLKDTNGRAVKLADYKGKVLMVDFWATWCGPCKIEIPEFIELYKKYKAQGFEIVGAVVQDPFTNAKPFAIQFRMNYPVLDANDRSDVEDAFGPFYGLPTSFLIGRDGRLCKTHVGLPQTRSMGDPAQIRALFEAEIKALL